MLWAGVYANAVAAAPCLDFVAPGVDTLVTPQEDRKVFVGVYHVILKMNGK